MASGLLNSCLLALLVLFSLTSFAVAQEEESLIKVRFYKEFIKDLFQENMKMIF